MSLKRYREKRDFRKTAEPKGRTRSRTGHSFVVQKHAARSLHYDFRLEMDGVLKSWAVPKGPSLDPRVKSLAIHVEDHPLEYASFEGVIPEGEYGGGSVMVWDRGTWKPHGDPAKSYQEGKLNFDLKGRKLKGRWALVQMHGKAGDDGRNWLLKKVDDAKAQRGSGYSLLKKKPSSAVTNRTIEEIAEDRDRTWSSTKNGGSAKGRFRKSERPKQKETRSKLGPRKISKATSGKPPASFKPQLATLVREVPDGDDWFHEPKFDGYRLLARTGAKREVRLLTRGGKDWTRRFPTVAKAIEELGLEQSLLDGEVVVLDSKGRTDFQALQNLMNRGRDGDVVYYLFDLPFVRGANLTRSPLKDRKRVLAEILAAQDRGGVARFSDHIEGRGTKVYQQACRLGLEGIVSKRASSSYQQRRSRDWVKVKCLKQQEFVIGGWTDPGGSRKGFGSLLLGYYEKNRLIYCGRVGTGFSRDSLRQIAAELDQVKAGKSPFDKKPPRQDRRGVHWVKPALVAEIEFTEWTGDGHLRHPSFQGLREDKRPRDVTREEPGRPTASAARDGKTSSSGHDMKETEDTIAGVRLSNPDRVLYPEQGLTKLDLAGYYAKMADWVLPHLINRPLTLVRCPKGRGETCFYQKHIDEGLSEAIRGVEIREKKGVRSYVAINDLAGLISLVQLGVLEIHPWGAQADNPDKPDRMIFDLDPGKGVPWKKLVAAAGELRERLEEVGLQAFLRTTGGSGLHVVVPLTRRSSWDDVKSFSRAVSQSMADENPAGYVATASKAKRTGKIYIDYLRNSRGATAVASYSSRARPGATVATPLRWDELSAQLKPDHYNTRNLPGRMSSLKKDPWAGFFETKQSLTKAVWKKLERAR